MASSLPLLGIGGGFGRRRNGGGGGGGGGPSLLSLYRGMTFGRSLSSSSLGEAGRAQEEGEEERVVQEDRRDFRDDGRDDGGRRGMR